MGVPAPAGAGLTLLPLIIWLQFPQLSEFSMLTPLIGLWVIVVAALMVSRLPTLSTKQFKLPAASTVPLLAAAGLFLAALVHAPWLTLMIMGLIYAASIPAGLQKYVSLKRKNALTAAPVPQTPAP
jgi:CDP-diacylglycerol--serine O-phosphatidyltransferase